MLETIRLTNHVPLEREDTMATTMSSTMKRTTKKVNSTTHLASPPRGLNIDLVGWKYRIDVWTAEEWASAANKPDNAMPLDGGRGYILFTARE
jgi:hypothetical protein